MKKHDVKKGEREEAKDGKARKLALNKETVRSLSEAQLGQVAGGRGQTNDSACC